jgi:N4-gp56 family major capsid protein
VATQTTTTGTLNSTQLRTYYDKVLLGRLLPHLTYAVFGQHKPMPSKAGQTVDWRKFSSLAAATTPLTEGVTPSGSALTVTNITATCEQLGDYVELSDILDFTAPDPVLTETIELQGEQVALTIDTKVRDVIVLGTNVQFHEGERAARINVVAGDNITAVAVRKAVRTLHTNKAPKITSILDASTGVGTKPVAAGYVGIISPSTHYDLKSVAGWQAVHEYAQNVDVFPGEVGALDEVRFIRTQNAAVATGLGGGGIDVHLTLVMGAGYFGIVAPMGVQTIIKDFGAGQDPLNQRATAGWKAYFITKRLQEACCVRIEHAVSA